MNNEDIFAIIKRYLCEIVEEIDPNTVSAEKSMKDLGASSLDIVEVVSCTMRELRVRIPRGELSKLKDIGGLVEMLQTEVAKKED